MQAQEASLGFAVASDVVYAVPLPDVLRGELRGLGLLQTALEQYLAFQDKGCVKCLWACTARSFLRRYKMLTT